MLFIYSFFANGNVNLKLLPSDNLLSTHILPPCFSTNSLHIESPNPVPFSPEVPTEFIV